MVTEPTMLFEGSGGGCESEILTYCGTVENFALNDESLFELFCLGIIDILGTGCFSPGRGILCSFGRVAEIRLFDFKELIGVKGGGAILVVRPVAIFVLS